MKDLSSTLNINELTEYLFQQLEMFFPDHQNSKADLYKIVDRAYQRVIFCFQHLKGKYYSDETKVYFNHLNGDQYCMFLYFVSREAFLMDSEIFYLKLSLLNKHLFSIDLFGHIEMPDIFQLVHPLGTIIGRANFSNYLVIYQGVTIGGVHSATGIDYPVIGEKVVCFSNCSIIGKAFIENNTVIGANTTIVGGRFNSGSTILGNYPKNVILQNDSRIFQELFFDSSLS